MAKPLLKRTKKPTTSTASMLSRIDPTTLNARGQALRAQGIRENRPIAANAVPGLGQAVRALAQAPGRTGGIGQAVRALARASRGSVPTSARPITPAMRASGEVARTLSADTRMRPKPKATKATANPLRRKKASAVAR